MEKNGNLVLTGWGYAEYVASAAVALKALGGNADVYGMSGVAYFFAEKMRIGSAVWLCGGFGSMEAWKRSEAVGSCSSLSLSLCV